MSRRVVLHFPESLVNRPVISNLVRHHDLEFSILRADVMPDEEGLLVLELIGSEESCERGMEYLADVGVRVQPLEQDVIRNEVRCTHCGACVPVCASGALSIDRSTMKVEFDSGKCMACELCVKACPVRAIDVHF